jgi:uncharacterized protein (TIGR02646 family)
MPEKWLDQAEQVLEQLKKVPAADRSKFINDHSEVWSQLKASLSRLSQDKCWYSEIRLAPSELEIDHFRPKSRVAKTDPPHSGYWWLAFSWKNFRLAYSLINKRRRDAREDIVQGKGCYFPLLAENDRVPDDAPNDTVAERPALIDPCVQADVRLLDYAVEDGKVVERYKADQDETRHLRAKTSIDLYHLNEGTLIRDRQELQVAIVHTMREIEALSRQRDTTGNLSNDDENRYDNLINQLGGWINSASRFSAFARACLTQAGDLGWNTELLVTT